MTGCDLAENDAQHFSAGTGNVQAVRISDKIYLIKVSGKPFRLPETFSNSWIKN